MRGDDSFTSKQTNDYLKDLKVKHQVMEDDFED
jgi:hypothetical protein